MIDAFLTLAIVFIALVSLALAADGLGRYVDRRRARRDVVDALDRAARHRRALGETTAGRRGR